jgi:hypothetical protein
MKTFIYILPLLILLTSCGNKIDLQDEDGVNPNSKSIPLKNLLEFSANMNEQLLSKLNKCDLVLLNKDSNNSDLSIENDNEMVYTPNLNFTGKDEVEVKCIQDNVEKIYQLSFNVFYKNHNPTGEDLTLELDEDTSKTFKFPVQDVDNDELTIQITNNPANGSIFKSGNDYTYTPSDNFSGSDFLEYIATDSEGNSSEIHRINFIVNSINDAPTTNSLTYTFVEDSVNNSITLFLNDVDSSSLTISNTSTSNGTLNCTNENCLYTPTTNFFGNDSFEYTVSDGENSSASLVNITVTAVNDSPTSNDLNLSTNEETPLNFALEGSDVDSSISYTQTNPSNGTLTCINEGCTYNPNPNFSGIDSFTYTVSDGVSSSSSNVNINVVGNNDSPTTSNQIVTLDEDTTKSFTLIASDPDNDNLTYIITQDVSNGTLNCTDQNCTYTPNPNYNGTDFLQYKVNDGTNDSNTSIVNLMVNPINDAPVSNNKTYNIFKNSFNNSITLDSNDIDNSLLVYTVESTTSNGTLNCIGKDCTYTPNLNYLGSDSFTFKTNDGVVDSNTATVNISVISSNNAPVSDSQNLTFTEDSVDNSITLTASDPDSSNLDYIIVSNPSNGLLNCTNENCTYTPNPNYNGSDVFSFKTNDGESDSNTVDINLTINPVNDVPIANNDSISTNEDTPINFQLNASDIDLDPLTYIVDSNPSNGTLNCTNQNCTYTPNTNYNGSDVFTFHVNDGSIDSNTATVSITINSINDAPILNSDSISTNEDIPFDFSAILTAKSSDPENDPISFEIVSNPTNGSITGTHPNLIYTPNASYNGSDSVSVRAFDGVNYSTVATYNITVNPINDAPVSNNLSSTGDEDTTLNFNLNCSDLENDPLNYIIVSSTSNGIINCTDDNCSYTPNLNYNGSDSFTYKCNDGGLDSNTSTVSLIINPVNDAPLLSSYSITINEDESFDLSVILIANSSDIENDSISFEIVSNPNNGVIIGSHPNLIYTPNTSYTGNDSISVRAYDGFDYSNIELINITVNPVNDAPVSNNLSFSGDEDTLLNFNLNCSDPENDSISYTVETNTTNGIINCTLDSCSYSPNSNYNGSDSFTYKCNDGSFDSNTSTVSLTINPINDQPIGSDNSIEIQEAVQYSGTLTGSDVDGDSLTFEIVSMPTNGSLSITNTSTGDFTYNTSVGDSGLDSFSYRISDGDIFSNTYTISLNITNYRDNEKVFSIKAEHIDENLIDFPIMFNLDKMGDHFWNNVQSDGEDIVVTPLDNSTRYSLELVNFNKSEKRGVLWVKLPLISSINNTNFKIQYNNDGAVDINFPPSSSIGGSEDVWSNGYVAVYHMNESSGSLFDSTSNGLTMTKRGGVEYLKNSAVNLDKSMRFNSDNGNNDLFYRNDSTGSPLDLTSEITIEAWINPSIHDTDLRVVQKRETINQAPYSLMIDNGLVNFRMYTGSNSYDIHGTTNLPTNSWSYVAGTFKNSGNTSQVFLNGVKEQEVSNFYGNPIVNNDLFEIGGVKDRNERGFKGYIDEVRVSNVKRRPAWIKANYYMSSYSNLFFQDEEFTTVVEEDSLNIAETNNVPNWTEVESNTNNISVENGHLKLIANNEVNNPQATFLFDNIYSTGLVEVSFDMFLNNFGGENYFEVFLQSINSSAYSTSNMTQGVLSNLKWGSSSYGMINNNGFGYESNNNTYELLVINGEWINTKVIIDLDSKRYKFLLKGNESAWIDFEDLSVNSVDGIRFYMNEVSSGNVQVLFDNIVVKRP